MKKCKHCGKTMRDSELFCPRCAREYRDDLYREKRTTVKEMDVDLPKKTVLPKLNKKTQTTVGLGLVLLVIFIIIPALAPLLIAVMIGSLLQKNNRKAR